MEKPVVYLRPSPFVDLFACKSMKGEGKVLAFPSILPLVDTVYSTYMYSKHYLLLVTVTSHLTFACLHLPYIQA